MERTDFAHDNAARQLDQERSIIDSVAKTLGSRPAMRHRFAADRAQFVYRQMTTLWTSQTGGLAHF